MQDSTLFQPRFSPGDFAWTPARAAEPGGPSEQSHDSAASAGGSTPPRDARHRVRREASRARYDRTDAYAILDAAWLGHVAFSTEGQPFVIPMLYVRDGDTLLLHGSIASRLQRTLAEGIECCVAVTHVDGLVLARSHFNHSVNYRSVVVFGRARPLLDPAAKAAALLRFVDAMLPGRGADARSAGAQELAATSVLALGIADVSAKIRAHGVKDRDDDLSLPFWSGVVPVRLAYGTPEPTDAAAAAMPLPRYVAALA